MRVLRDGEKGLSLIELMVALVIGAIVIAGVYRTFMAQQRTFVVQEQISEAQQSARAIMDIIARDIRMAGFGMPGWAVAGLTNRITITASSPADFTIVGVFSGPIATLASAASLGQTQITLNTMGQNTTFNKDDNLLIFESDRPLPPLLPAGSELSAPLRYKTVVVWTAVTGSNPTVSIDADGSTSGVQDGLDRDLRANALVYRVGTVHYRLNGTDLERNGSVLANNVINFQITDQYNPGPPPVPETFGKYQIQLTVQTRTNDPDFPGGFRTRSLTSTIRARNLFLSS
ncbi:MAG: prepilin-type N-terminal cleavage/methylation domain-containing protein [Deltaproteobacteria bacterium]|nr:prepilin-type N-terminal cleavage/methylation domain-containing protein [Deltaproteobacteria bacterium]